MGPSISEMYQAYSGEITAFTTFGAWKTGYIQVVV